MPRLPVDGKKVIEHRITFGTKEREILADLSTSYRIEALKVPELLNFLDDPSKIIEVAYSVAIIAEMFGFETGLPTPVDLLHWFQERDATGAKVSESGQPSLWDTIRDFLTSSGDFEGLWPGGY